MKKIGLLLVIVFLNGCAFVAHPINQRTNESKIISYSGNSHNGGIIRIDPSGGRIVSQDYKDRYNALIDLYGDQFEPALKPNNGLIDKGNGEWLIDKEHHIKALQMSQWKRDGRIPTSTWKRLLNKVS